MTGLTGEIDFDAFAVVVARVAEELATVLVTAVVADALAVGVLVFVTHGLVAFAGADLPDFAAGDVHAPDAVVD